MCIVWRSALACYWKQRGLSTKSDKRTASLVSRDGGLLPWDGMAWHEVEIGGPHLVILFSRIVLVFALVDTYPRLMLPGGTAGAPAARWLFPKASMAPFCARH